MFLSVLFIHRLLCNVSRALTIDNLSRSFMQNVPVLGGCGIFLAEMGDIEEAVPMLQKSVELDPDNGFEKYL